ncbi:hypothetical protein GRJ2_001895300 [Grus japonensis]|uniref:Uncharacterized protein n=1 Tax=Grus japonensis TaxID=30415 RepID=A0ABC9X9K1_GRUJA
MHPAGARGGGYPQEGAQPWLWMLIISIQDLSVTINQPDLVSATRPLSCPLPGIRIILVACRQSIPPGPGWPGWSPESRVLGLVPMFPGIISWDLAHESTRFLSRPVQSRMCPAAFRSTAWKGVESYQHQNWDTRPWPSGSDRGPRG